MDFFVLAQATSSTLIEAAASVPASPAGGVDVAKAVYLFCMVSGLLWLLLTAFLGPLIGEFGGHDADVFHLQGDIHFTPLSPSVISIFMGSFGAGGLLAMGLAKISSLQALPLAMAMGLVVAGFIYYLIRHVFLTVQGGIEMAADALIGLEAEVITSIPEKGLGQITFAGPTGRQTVAARTEDNTPVPLHSVVEIMTFSSSQAVVRLKQAGRDKAA
ncbi:MAG: hypothetical protein NTX50_06560 [Candidatus Sumerlaeota bacterium]|nr:hypothetical protein [Candidatus Sumerlaeota bacterium]